MKLRITLFSGAVITLSILLAVQLVFAARSYAALQVNATVEEQALEWVDFTIPYAALDKALRLDIDTYGNEVHLDWVELLAVLGTRYGGNWKAYKAADMDQAVQGILQGQSPQQLASGYGDYTYYHTAYRAVLGGFVGEFQKEVPDKNNPGLVILEDRYGLKAYSPIAEGYSYSHYRDFGNSRSYGYARPHFGNDLCGSVGTPIIAVEGGIVEEIGWNQYGGWRVGIRSFDRKRYYYYAHMRKDRPYAAGLEEGAVVQAGDVIGYLGMTGYSTTENINGMQIPHLHFGIQLIFDEAQKDSPIQLWIDVYSLVELLERNRATVVRDEETKEYIRKYRMFDQHVAGGD